MVVPLQAKRKFTEKFLDSEIESLREKVASILYNINTATFETNVSIA